MKDNRFIRWTQYDTEGLVSFGQMPISEIDGEIRKIERQAAWLLRQSGAEHVIYALKCYDENDVLDHVKFYLIPLSDEEFEKEVANLTGCRVYALHKHSFRTITGEARRI